MTKIYLIRHAEAEGNLYRRVQGHYNGDITQRGYKQINLLAERFRDVEIDALYASDLQRTQWTKNLFTGFCQRISTIPNWKYLDIEDECVGWRDECGEVKGDK